MSGESKLTPNALFCAFKDERVDTSQKAIVKFEKLDKKTQAKFLGPTIEFLNTEDLDRIRGWGIAILEIIGKPRAFRYLMGLLKDMPGKQKNRYPYTRFFALKAAKVLSKNKSRKDEVDSLIEELAKDRKEHLLVRTEARILLALAGKKTYEEEFKRKLRGMNDSDNYDENYAILRGIQEFPLPRLAGSIVRFVGKNACYYPDLVYRATMALGGYTEDASVVRALGSVIRFNPYSFLRSAAISSIEKIKDPDATNDVLIALTDGNAEVRLGASKAIGLLLNPENAVSAVVELILRKETPEDDRCMYVEALRNIDPERKICTNILETELGSEDRERSNIAEKTLIELGGWAAIQKVSQLRSTLEYLDKLLKESEQVAKSAFTDTLHQAHFNFYFAMVINGLLVGIGIFLVYLAINQLILSPEKLTDWIVPGGAGLFGILTSMFFNNPRKNARDDLRALMNVTVIFLGFLRQLNEIDATFKHAYISRGHEFGTGEMKETVSQIDHTMRQTLRMASQHLQLGKYLPEPENPVEPEKPTEMKAPAASDQ